MAEPTQIICLPRNRWDKQYKKYRESFLLGYMESTYVQGGRESEAQRSIEAAANIHIQMTDRKSW